jgi:hypothetical protein
MPQFSFGQVINVTGPNNGFVGTVSRQGERVITAREFSPFTTTNNLNFGDPSVIVPNATGGVFDSVADFVANATSNIGLVAQYFAGMAVREVKTQLTYGAGLTPGIQLVGYYANLQMAEVLERGSGTILLSVGSPNAEAQVYTRVVANTAVPAGVIGDWETNPAATDLFTLTGATAAAAGQTAITLTGTNVLVGQVVSGPGIVPGTYVVSGTGTAGAYTAIVLSNALTTAITATSPLTFSNLVALPNVVARTGNLDSNNVLEITIKVRNAA